MMESRHAHASTVQLAYLEKYPGQENCMYFVESTEEKKLQSTYTCFFFTMYFTSIHNSC